jgi:copper homeostasis protein
MARILLEVCVDSAAGLDAAVAGGADRIELCSALEIGGLTPAPGLMRRAAGCGLPVHAMVRAGPGGFVLSGADLEVMLADIAAVRAAGLAGVVFGAVTPGGRLDVPALKRLCDAARGLDLTLHRAVDLCEDAEAAVGQAIALGFHRILSSGGARTAPEGVDRLAVMFRAAAGRITIMPGSGVTAARLPLLRALPLREVHASCALAVPAGARETALGFAGPGLRRTDAGQVAALQAALGN